MSKKNEPLSYENLGSKLLDNGWRPSRDLKYAEVHVCRLYEMTIPSVFCATIRVWLSDSHRALKAHGAYGIIRLEVSKYPIRSLPFEDYDVDSLMEAIELAEDNLLAIGVPFASRRKFHGSNAANKRRRNETLRKKFNLDENEKADMERMNAADC